MAQRRLSRSRTDRKLAGVCGGLGEYFDVDPVLFRIGFVVAGLAGAGVLLYLAAWIALPDGAAAAAPAPAPSAPRQVSTLRLVVGGILLVIGLGAVFSDPWDGPFGHGLFAWSGPAIAIAAVVGVALWLMRDDRPGGIAPAPGAAGTTPPPEPPPAPGTAVVLAGTGSEGVVAPSTWPAPGAARPAGEADGTDDADGDGGGDDEDDDGGDGGDGGGGASGGGGWDLPPPGVDAPPSVIEQDRRPSATVLTVAALAVFAAVATLGSSAGLWDISFAVGLGCSLVIVAAGLVSSIWLRGGVLLIPLALLLIPVTAFVSRVDVPLSGGTGQRHVTYLAAEDLEDEHLLAGRLTLDYRDLELPPGEIHEMSASVAFGELRVLAPDGTGVVVEIDSDVTFGEDRSARRISLDDAPADAPVLHLDLEVGAGEIDVFQA